jgi:Protein of unknown function (DUF3238)
MRSGTDSRPGKLGKRSAERSRRTRFTAALLALGLASGAITATGESLSSQTASAATTTQLVTAADVPALAQSVLATSYTTSPKAVISQNDPTSISVAGNFATRNDLPLLISTSGTSAAALTSTLTTLASTSVFLVSTTPNYFTAAFVTSLGSRTVTSYFQGSEPFALSSAAALTPSGQEYAIARTEDSAALNLAISYASTRGIPLLILSATSSSTTMAGFFTQIATASKVFFGLSSQLPFEMVTAGFDSTGQIVDVSDLRRAYTWVAGQSQAAGAISNQVVVAASDSRADLTLAGILARKTRATLAPAGAKASLTADSRANEYLTLWKSAVQKIVLVGTSLTAANLTTVASPSGLPIPTDPVFRVTDLVKNSTNYTLSYTAVSGATRYRAYDLAGTLLATSTTTSMAIAQETGAFLLSAENSSGAQVKRLQTRVNEYATTTLRPSVVIATADAGTNRLIFLGNPKLPRLITREDTDFFSQFPVDPVEVPIGIVCGSSFTETGMNQTLEYTYRVHELTNVSARACDAAAPISPSTTANLNFGEVTLPPTGSPGLRTAPDQKVAASTSMDRLLAPIFSPTNSGGDQSRAAQFPNLVVRWMAYIPEAKIPFGPSGDLLYPVTFFSGDNHGTNMPSASARFKQTVTFKFGPSHTILYAEEMGTTYQSKCNPFACVNGPSATASLNELNYSEVVSGTNSGSIRVTASATIPLVNGAPPIDADWTIRFAPGNSGWTGYNDNMPQHELYIGPEFSEFNREYKSPYVSFVQLPCLFSSPSLPVRGCFTFSNRLL